MDLVKHQVRYLGLVENVRVRRAGFCFRQPYDKFLWRYKILSPKTWPEWRGDAKAGVQELIKHLGLQPADYQLGKTKLFLKEPKTVFRFEEERENALPVIVAKLQLCWRGYKVRDQLDSWAKALQDAFRGVGDDPAFGKNVRWPTPHKSLARAEVNVKKIHANWRAMKIVTGLPPQQQDTMRHKCLAYSHVNGMKPWNFNRTWSKQYVTDNPKFDGE